MKEIYIGFFEYAGYDLCVVETTEEKCWKAMKAEYYKWRKGYNGSMTFKYAVEYFGYRVEKTEFGKIVRY